MGKHGEVQGAAHLIGRPKYVSSPPLPAWTRGSVYTRGASWSVWDNTVTRFLTKPARKEIATAGRHRHESVIAKMRSSPKEIHLKKEKKRKCSTETTSTISRVMTWCFLRAKVVLVWVWYPWLYRTYLFFFLFFDIDRNLCQLCMFIHNKPVCFISVFPSACNITASDSNVYCTNQCENQQQLYVEGNAACV